MKAKAEKLQSVLSGQGGKLSGQAAGSNHDADSAATRRSRGLVRTDLWLPADVAQALDEYARRFRLTKTEALTKMVREAAGGKHSKPSSKPVE